MVLQVQPLQNKGTISGVGLAPKPQSLTMAKPVSQPTISIAQPAQQQPISVQPLQNKQTLTPGVVDATGQKASPYLGTPQEHTVSELGWKVKQKHPEYSDLSDEELGQKMKVKFPEYSDFKDAAQPEQPGFLKRLGQGIARTPIQVAKAGVGLIDLLGSKVPGISDETKSMLEKRGTETIQSPTFGETPSYSLKEGLGKGFELGSYAIGGGGAAGVAEAGLKGLVKQGAIQGAKSGLGAGLAAGFGSGLQEEGNGLGGVLTDTALGGLGGAVTGGALGALGGGLGKGIGSIKNRGVQNFSKEADDAIIQGIERGVKPSVVGKKTAPMYNQFLDRSKLAVKYITEAKDELGLKTLPKTLDEFSEAITKAKNNVFSKYNFLSETAGKGKAKVYLEPLAKELNNIASDPILSDMNPAVAKYAQDLANTYSKRGSYTPAEAQRAIELFNSKLKAFYKNPNPDVANKIYVESMVVNNLRKLQDETIQNATGQNYQGLKNVYGALADLEKEVSHRAVVVGRQNLKGLADLSDIFTGGQIIEGILNGSPIQISKGLIGKTISTTYKALNNPDRLIEQMFKKVGSIAESANKKGTKLVPSSELKTMLSLPSPGSNSPKGRLPTINLNPIYQPSRVVDNSADALNIPRSRVGIKPKYREGGGKITQIFGEN